VADRGKEPRVLFVAAWLLMAIGYSASGLHKLQSPSWIDGSALQRLVENPLSRPTFLSGLLTALPPFALQLATWTALFMEVSFALFALSRRTRPWIWLALVGMHVGIMLLVDFVDLTLGMLMIHLFTFDQRWIPAREAAVPLAIRFSGGSRAAERLRQFLTREDGTGALSVPPAHDTAESSILLASEAETTYRDSDAVIRIGERLGGIWRLFSLLAVVPKAPRDRLCRILLR
jgi:hypothetical protein